MRETVNNASKRASKEENKKNNDPHAQERVVLHTRAQVGVAVLQLKRQKRFQHL